MHNEEMASKAEEFWARRRDITPPTYDSDSKKRLVLLADVSDAFACSAYERVVGTLSEFSCFDPVPHEILHLTVKLFDDPVESVTINDNPIKQIDEMISHEIMRTDPFEISLTQFNIFPDVVYAEIDDDGKLGDINRRLCAHAETTTLDRDGEEFIPHLTFGYLDDISEYDKLINYLESNRELDLPTLNIDELSLVVREVGEHPPVSNHLKTYEL
ncbi:2'-5' RNA ligase family protein [Haloquadratum walsbyi]|jgi:2'-5' RNA ligase|uniref:2'-5' RNA ligase family protein n=1 Tax=Haloquadratum walsbyi TaxID=293091 RepID=UPI0023F3AB96|nr:2'-5' RNA ligase family protein [Haloquadratum walsbyi]